MGVCTSKPKKPNPFSIQEIEQSNNHASIDPSIIVTPKTKTSGTPKKSNNSNDDDDDVVVVSAKQSPFFPFYSPSPARFFRKSPAPASASSTPGRIFRRPFPPPSPAKHIKAFLAKRQGRRSSGSAAGAAIPEGGGEEVDLDKRFGFCKEFVSRVEVGEEVGRGHFGYTCSARFKKGEHKGKQVAVKVIPKAKVDFCLSLLFLVDVVLLHLPGFEFLRC